MTCTARLARLLVPAALLLSASAQAQDYPNKDIHFICGFGAGTGADTIVRYYAEKLRPIINRTILVENRAGAGANTILVHGGSGLASNMHVYKKPPVPSVDAFQIFATINQQAFMLVTDTGKPWKTVAELTAAMKQKGDKATYGTGAPASVVLGAIYKASAGLSSVEVNYKQSADAFNDMLGGALDYAVMEPVFSTAQQRQGKLRVLAVSSDKRLNAAPDFPTMIEAGIPGASMSLWWAAMVPATTPKPVIAQLNKWFDQVTATEETKKFLNGFASDPWIATPEQAQEKLRQDEKAWAEYMRIGKLEPQG
jgi:tripartite-type tricarboxylate transporter receptor subunit TctC